MSKWANTLVLDGLLDKVSEGTRLIVNTKQPTDRSDAVSDGLAETTLSSGDFNKDDASNGRKITIAQKANFDVDSTGDASHVSIVDGSNLLYVTTVSPGQRLTSGNKVTTPSWSITVAKPS